jgi:hypothetical protein
MDLEVDFLKLRFSGQQNLTLIFGREGKYEKMKQFPSASNIESMGRDSTIAKRKATNSFVTSVLQLVIRRLSPYRFSRNFIF